MSRMGRQRLIATSGSSRWLNTFVDLLASQRIPPTSNVKFRGTTNSRLKSWPTSGVSARRPSTQNLNGSRQSDVCSIRIAALPCAATRVGETAIGSLPQQVAEFRCCPLRIASHPVVPE